MYVYVCICVYVYIYIYIKQIISDIKQARFWPRSVCEKATADIPLCPSFLCGIFRSPLMFTTNCNMGTRLIILSGVSNFSDSAYKLVAYIFHCVFHYFSRCLFNCPFYNEIHNTRVSTYLEYIYIYVYINIYIYIYICTHTYT